MRELFDMAAGAFAPSASIVCALAETNRDRKKRTRPHSEDEFNPYIPEPMKRRARIGTPLTKDTLGMLAEACGVKVD